MLPLPATGPPALPLPGHARNNHIPRPTAHIHPPTHYHPQPTHHAHHHHHHTQSRVANTSSTIQPPSSPPPPLPANLSPLSHPSVQSSQPTPPSHPPPPPPPPPRLPIAAFTAATSAASRLPPSRRRPTLHLAVIVASSSPPASLLRHAHAALVTLAAKGVHVFLQTEIEHVPSQTLAPITHEAVAELVATSNADFMLLVSDRNLHPPSVQLRLSAHADFVDVPLNHLTHVVLDAWMERIRRVPDVLQSVSLAMNPNVLTASHLHLFLQSFARFPPIQPTIAKLARLATITHHWRVPSIHPTPPATASDPHPTSDGCASPPVTASDHHASLSPAPQSRHSTQASDSSETPASSLPHVPKHLIDAAVKSAWTIIQSPSIADEPPPAKSDLSYSWLRRARNLSAQLVRSQLLARHMHRNLLSVFDTVSTMPIAPTQATSASSMQLPTLAHRQRLLREINDLLPRIEQLAARLTKRPRVTRRRRRNFIQANPWTNYLARVEAPLSGAGIAGGVGRAERLVQAGGWQCVPCGTCNDATRRECSACGGPAWLIDPSHLPVESDRLTSVFRDSVKKTTGVPSPWVFAPGIVPPLPMGVSDSRVRDFRGGGRPDDTGFHPSELGGSGSAPGLHVRERDGGGRRNATFDPTHVRNGMYDLNGAFDGLAFDEVSNGFGRVDAASGVRGGLKGGLVGQTVFGLNGGVPTSPLRLAGSLGNGGGVGGGGPTSMVNSMVNLTPQRGIMNSAPATGVGHLTAMMSSLPNGRSGARGSHNGVRSPYSSGGGGGGVAGSSNVVDAIGMGHGFSADVLFGAGAGGGGGNGGVGGNNVGMEKVTGGCYNTTDDLHRYNGMNGSNGNGFGRRSAGGAVAASASALASASASAPGIGAGLVSSPGLGESNSLEMLAAASDAANGGTGSATKESLRAVSALVTPSRSNGSSSSTRPPLDGEDHHHLHDTWNSTYNMF